MRVTIDHRVVVEAAYGLPPLPQSATRLTALIAKSDPDIREIVKTIEFDSALTMRLLRVANSAMSASASHIGSVRQAVVRMGTSIVTGIAIGTGMRTMIGRAIPGYGINEKQFWRHSLAAAFCAEAIQPQAKAGPIPLAFTAAILHDIGKLVLGQFLTTTQSTVLARAISEGQVTPFRAECELLSLHHGEVGGVIAQHWNLPATLVDGIIYHHQPLFHLDNICSITFLANIMAHEMERLASEALFDAPVWNLAELEPAMTKIGLTEEGLAVAYDSACENFAAVVDQLE